MDFHKKRIVAGRLSINPDDSNFQGVKRPKFWCRQFGFSRRWPESGSFGSFLGPRGPKWNIHFLHLTQKERCTGRAECIQVTLFPHDCWVFEAKMRLGPVSGVPGPKSVLGNARKQPKATERNCATGPFMHESGKLEVSCETGKGAHSVLHGIALHCIVLHGILLYLIICFWYCIDYTVLCSNTPANYRVVHLVILFTTFTCKSGKSHNVDGISGITNYKFPFSEINTNIQI